MGTFTGAMPAPRGTSFARLDSEPDLRPRFQTHGKRPPCSFIPPKKR